MLHRRYIEDSANSRYEKTRTIYSVAIVLVLYEGFFFVGKHGFVINHSSLFFSLTMSTND